MEIEIGKLIKKAKLIRCGDGEYPVLSMTMHDGLMFQNDRFKKQIASVDQSQYQVVQRHQLVESFPIDEGVLAVQELTDAGIVSPAYKIWDVDMEKVVPKYLEFALRAPKSIEYYKFKLRGTTARRRSIPDAEFCAMRIKCPSLDEQKIIVDTIEKTKRVIDSRNLELDTLDDLIKARFVEMFGDMHLNSRKWYEAPLETMADVISGITKGRKIKEQKLIEVPYMAVSNVKDGYIDWTTIKTIEATEHEIKQYKLLPDDVLMTEGGDPDKLGRGAVIEEPLENCIHQNHIFRVRLCEEVVLPVFFAEYLKHQKAKRYFLGCAKQTTGIASINMRQLRALPVLVPPVELQKEFADFVNQVDKSKLLVQKSLDETQVLFNSLMQKYFG